MKNILICFFLILSMPISVFSQSAFDNPYAIFHGAKPKGKVDSVLIYHYPYESALESYLYVYNRKGQLIKFNIYRRWINPDFGTKNRDTAKRVYSYNKAGKLVSSGPRKTVYQYLSTKSGYTLRTGYYDTTKVFEMQFNKSGQMTQSGVYKLNDLQRQETGFEYQYNSKGYLIGQTDYYDGRPANRSSYKYDSNGDEVEIIRAAGRDYSRRSICKYSNYDKMHNWTLQTVDFVNAFEVDDSIHWPDTIHRRITYYK